MDGEQRFEVWTMFFDGEGGVQLCQSVSQTATEAAELAEHAATYADRVHVVPQVLR